MVKRQPKTVDPQSSLLLAQMTNEQRLRQK